MLCGMKISFSWILQVEKTLFFIYGNWRMTFFLHEYCIFPTRVSQLFFVINTRHVAEIFTLVPLSSLCINFSLSTSFFFRKTKSELEIQYEYVAWDLFLKRIAMCILFIDLLLHVKRQMCTAKKTGERQTVHRNQSSKEKPSDTNNCFGSVNTAWNRTLYTAVPIVPWQTPLQMPFTLFAPFCTPYQLAQLQQGPKPGIPSFQGLEPPGRIEPCLTEPPLLGTQSFGGCGVSEKPSSSETVSPGGHQPHEPLPVKADKSKFSNVCLQ